jgi:tocopherol O-methyltransferase
MKSIYPEYKNVGQYYDENTDDFYRAWNKNHLHFGIFLDEDFSDDNIINSDLPIMRMIDKITSCLPLNNNSFIVDAGCGIGGTLFYLAKKYSCKGVGVNIAPYQLQLCGDKAKELDLSDKIKFQYADCSILLPFDDNSVDAIIHMETACHYKNVKNFFSECYRILKPGGFLVAEEWMSNNHLNHEGYLSYIKPIIEAWFLHELPSLEGYKLLLQNANFKIMEAVYIEEGILPNINAIKTGIKHNMFSFLSLLLNGGDPKILRKRCMWYEQASTLVDAWEKGYFKLGYYVAKKI